MAFKLAYLVYACRLLIDHNKAHQKDQALAEQLLRELMNIDPSCPEVIQLAEILIQKGMHILLTTFSMNVVCMHFLDKPNYSEIQDILSRFLEYPHNSNEPKALELFSTVLKSK